MELVWCRCLPVLSGRRDNGHTRPRNAHRNPDTDVDSRSYFYPYASHPDCADGAHRHA